MLFRSCPFLDLRRAAKRALVHARTTAGFGVPRRARLEELRPEGEGAALADAFAWAHQAMQPAIELQKELVAKLAVEPLPYDLVKPDEAILAEVEQWCQGKFTPDMRQQYPYRNRVVEELRQQMHTELEAQHGEAYAEVKAQSQ